MPWHESCIVDERMSFIIDWRRGDWPVAELCWRHGVSRKTAYKWIGRYRAEGPAGLADRSHAAKVHGLATPPEVVAAIVEAKGRWPQWGPRKLASKLRELHPETRWPADSTTGEILRRAGLTGSRRRRRRAPPTLGGLTVPEAPNMQWAVDYKGWVRLGDGSRCEPLTITDGFSRYLIGLHACSAVGEAEARPAFERAFADHGLPEIIRSDNGAPFAANSVTGLTWLGVWWAKLGIRHERIAPGRPQQNGRHERFHLTLLEAMQPRAANLADQTRRFAAFAHEYNEERPHEALKQVPPAKHYTPSPRPVPEHLPEPDYPPGADIRRVRSNGCIKWAGDLIFISSALIGEIVAIEEGAEGDPVMRFYNTPIGVIDTGRRRLRPVVRRDDQTEKVSPIHPV
jgi:transposase InsO family protein